MIDLTGQHLQLICDGCQARLSVACGGTAQQLFQNRQRLLEIVGALGWGMAAEKVECPACVGEQPVTANEILADYKTYNERLKNEVREYNTGRSGDSGGAAGRTGGAEQVAVFHTNCIFGAHHRKRPSNRGSESDSGSGQK